MIHDTAAEGVFVIAGQLLAELKPSSGFRSLFERALEQTRAKAGVGALFLPIDVPLAVGDAIGLPRDEQLLVATASTLLWTGADMMDDYADGDLSESWNVTNRHELALAWTNLLATLPHLVTWRSSLADRAAADISRRIAACLWTMSEGQFTDLGSPDRVNSVSSYLSMVQKKSGSEVGLFAALPAILADLSQEQIERWTRFGEELGTMIQLMSDLRGTFDESPKSDLHRGKRSLAALHATSVLKGDDADLFAQDLAMAQLGDRAGAQRARNAMQQCSAVSSAIAQAEVFRYRAAAAIPIKLTAIDIEHPLRKLLRCFSVL